MNVLRYLFRENQDELMQKEVQLFQQQQLPKYIFGEDNIRIGDKFFGYACGWLFENQTCTKIDQHGLIYGTTTLAIFDKKYIKKY